MSWETNVDGQTIIVSTVCGNSKEGFEGLVQGLERCNLPTDHKQYSSAYDMACAVWNKTETSVYWNPLS